MSENTFNRLNGIQGFLNPSTSGLIYGKKRDVMSIPESQLHTWTNQGAVTTAKATHESIRSALAAEASSIANRLSRGEVEVFLQGSYRNSTNIRGDSDVDVVVQLDTTWGGDLSALSPTEKAAYNNTYAIADYQWGDFRADVLEALRRYYGSAAIQEGNKSIKVVAGSGRLAADVVPALLYKKFYSFSSTNPDDFVPGIKFYDRSDNRQIINFPRPHYDNGVSKNMQIRTSGRYKPAVRMFKNARTYLVRQSVISEELGPSYFLECLIYNVPDGKFGESWQDTYAKSVNWLLSASMPSFVCQNGQQELFGPTPEQWSTSDASALESAFVELWNGWS